MAARELPSGTWPVMVTPFREDRSIDWRGVDALTDWYLRSGAVGLFAVAQTSEMYALSDEERIALARRVVTRVGGQVPVVASGTFGGSIEAQIRSVVAMADTGVDAVVAITSQVARMGESDQVLADRLVQLLDGARGVALGLYECPLPYKRLLSEELIETVAKTSGFVFLKDTSESPTAIAKKIPLVTGSPLKLFNAEMSSLLESVRAGAHGFCGNAGNYYPELVQWLCTEGPAGGETAERVQQLMTVVDAVVSSPLYPASAKQFLASARGLDVLPVCRVTNARLGEHDLRQLVQLDAFVRSVDLPVALV